LCRGVSSREAEVDMKFSPPPPQTWWRRFRRTARWSRLAIVLSMVMALIGAVLTMFLAFILIMWPVGAIAESIVLGLHLNSREETTAWYDSLVVLIIAGAVGGACGGALFYWLRRSLPAPEQQTPIRPLRQTVLGGASMLAVIVLILSLVTR